MNSLFRRVLYFLLRKDFIVLNPDWSPISKTEGLAVVGRKSNAAENYLPIKYNYHTDANWRIQYDVIGSKTTRGVLSFSLSLSSGEELLRTEFTTALPCRVGVSLEGNSLVLSGTHSEIFPIDLVRKKSRRLHAEFEFTDANGAKRIRRMSHLIRVPAADQIGEEYFRGAVYEDYDQDASYLAVQVLEKICQYALGRRRFLDIGCATGLIVKEACLQGFDGEGVDVSSWAVEQANAITGGKCRVLNVGEAKPTDFIGKYDVICIHSVIEHLPDPGATLDLIAEITNDNAIVYLQTLNADSLTHKLLGSDWCGYSDYTHQSPWITQAWLTEAFLERGFEILENRTRGVWLDNKRDVPWAAWAFLLQSAPSSLLLEEGFGDFVEIVAQKRIGKLPQEP